MSAGLTGGGLPALRLPDPAAVFLRRSKRLEDLAGAGEDPFLAFLGRLAKGQREAVAALASGTRAQAGRLDPGELAGDPALPAALSLVLAAAGEGPLPDAARETVAALGGARHDEVSRLARGALAGTLSPVEAGAAIFLGAALQAVAAVRAAALDPETLPGAEGNDGACPACGGAPVAGILRGDDRARYLACALCATEWYLPRIRCAACGESAGIGYRHLGDDRGARAETCEACHAYVKLFDLEARPSAEPCADDAATLALDVALGEEGFGRAGPNLLLGWPRTAPEA